MIPLINAGRRFLLLVQLELPILPHKGVTDLLFVKMKEVRCSRLEVWTMEADRQFQYYSFVIWLKLYQNEKRNCLCCKINYLTF